MYNAFLKFFLNILIKRYYLLLPTTSSIYDMLCYVTAACAFSIHIIHFEFFSEYNKKKHILCRYICDVASPEYKLCLVIPPLRDGAFCTYAYTWGIYVLSISQVRKTKMFLCYGISRFLFSISV